MFGTNIFTIHLSLSLKCECNYGMMIDVEDKAVKELMDTLHEMSKWIWMMYGLRG